MGPQTGCCSTKTKPDPLEEIADRYRREGYEVIVPPRLDFCTCCRCP